MAPLNTTVRPSQYKQSSRKGKKAWRKNIDLTDIESSLENKRQQEITHGTADISSLKDNALFEVDVEGNNVLKEKLIKRNQIKKNLKSTEILEAIKTNSKVGILQHHKIASQNEKSKKKVQGVSKKELNRLMALAGRTPGESVAKNTLAKDGLVRSGSNDLWGEDKYANDASKIKKICLPSGIQHEVTSKADIPEELFTYSTTSWTLPANKPTTLDRAPIQVKEHTDMPHAGKSYNPDNKEWSGLLEKEYKLEQVKEDRRIALQEYRERIRYLMDTIEDNEEESSSEEDEVEEEEEEEEDGVIRLSVNEVVKNKKKTKYQRNKAKKHQEKVKIQQELKKLKEHVKKLENFEEIEEDVKIDHEMKKLLKQQVTKVEKKNKKHRLGTKFSVMEDTLEVKFKDELSDSLRKLKPEGNLLYDTVRKLQSSGKIESRVHVKRGRRYKQKITEKWTYKDFK